MVKAIETQQDRKHWKIVPIDSELKAKPILDSVWTMTKKEKHTHFK